MALRDDFTAVIRRKHYSRRTERTYWAWIGAFLRFHREPTGWRHPSRLGAAEIEAFLTHLAVERHVAASTQNQALNAIAFFYKQVLEIDLGAVAADCAWARHIPCAPWMWISIDFRRHLGEAPQEIRRAAQVGGV